MSRKILIGTKNADKVREVRHAIADLGFELIDLSHYPDVEEPVEDGDTLEANARLKALYYARKTGQLVLSDDSGLEVDALGGQPGVYSSRYAGEGATYEDNNRKLLDALRDVPEGRRGASFRCVIAVATADRVLLEVAGVCQGEILSEMRGTDGFGFDPVFYVPQQGNTFAQMGLDQKNRLSHRAQALAKLAVELKKVLKTIDPSER